MAKIADGTVVRLVDGRGRKLTGSLRSFESGGETRYELVKATEDRSHETVIRKGQEVPAYPDSGEQHHSAIGISADDLKSAEKID